MSNDGSIIENMDLSDIHLAVRVIFFELGESVGRKNFQR
jgi:hypothetical protein